MTHQSVFKIAFLLTSHGPLKLFKKLKNGTKNILLILNFK